MKKNVNVFLSLIVLLSAVSCGPSELQLYNRKQQQIIQQNAHDFPDRWARLKKGMTEEEVYKLIPEATPFLQTPIGWQGRPMTRAPLKTVLFRDCGVGRVLKSSCIRLYTAVLRAQLPCTH